MMTTSRGWVTTILVTQLMLASGAMAQPVTQEGLSGRTAESPIEVLYGFTLIDGRGGAPLPDAAIATRGNEIVRVGPRAELAAAWGESDEVVWVDLEGGWVVPGLIDSHVHLATVPNRARAEDELRRMLYAGITSVRDMAGDGRALASLARDSRLGEITAPDVYYAALMAGPTFLADPRPQASAAGEIAGRVPWMQAITPGTDMVRAVARAKGTFADGIKIYANLEASEVRHITEEAHNQGMKVWAHSMVFPARPLEVVLSGVDVISHVCRLAWEAMADAPREYHHRLVPDYDNFTVDAPVFTQLFEEMRARGTILDATLALYTRMDEQREAASGEVPPIRCRTAFARDLVRRANSFGIPIAAGTDFSAPPDAPYPALHDEVEELVGGGGLTPLEAISSATRVGALVLGIEGTHGTLQAGKSVNFVLLERDPTADISNLRTVRAVFKNAARFQRVDFTSSR